MPRKLSHVASCSPVRRLTVLPSYEPRAARSRRSQSKQSRASSRPMSRSAGWRSSDLPSRRTIDSGLRPREARLAVSRPFRIGRIETVRLALEPRVSSICSIVQCTAARSRNGWPYPLSEFYSCSSVCMRRDMSPLATPIIRPGWSSERTTRAMFCPATKSGCCRRCRARSRRTRAGLAPRQNCLRVKSSRLSKL